MSVGQYVDFKRTGRLREFASWSHGTAKILFKNFGAINRRYESFLVPLDQFQPLNDTNSTKKNRPKIKKKQGVFFQFFGQIFLAGSLRFND